MPNLMPFRPGMLNPANLIQASLRQLDPQIVEVPVAAGMVHGKFIFSRKVQHKRAVLFAHGITSNRNALTILMRRLVLSGCYCLAIDLPAHNENISPFSLGNISEAITEGVALLKQQSGIPKVAVISHSIGAMGALFSSMGYNSDVEKDLYMYWEMLERLLAAKERELEGKVPDNGTLQFLETQVSYAYEKIRRLIFSAIRHKIELNADVSCYIFLALPHNLAAIRTAAVLNRIPKIRVLLKLLMRQWGKSSWKTVEKERTQGLYPAPLGNKGPNTVDVVSLRMDVYEFFSYMAQMKEPADFLKIMEALTQLRDKDEEDIKLKGWYNLLLKNKPKLFVYGDNDFFLTSWFPSFRARLEKYYRACGNAKIIFGSFSHVFEQDRKNRMITTPGTNVRVLNEIMAFLNAYA